MRETDKYAQKPKCEPTVPMLVNEIARIFDEHMRQTTVDPMQTQNSCRLILRALSHMEGCTQLDLVKDTHLKPPTISVTLKRLEDAGYVRREADENDLRAVRVYLTEKGQELNAATWRRLKSCDAVLMRDISDEEQAYLLSVLTKMRNNILEDLTNRHETH